MTSLPNQLSLDADKIPVDGALGLLAYGDIALTAWRDKRCQVYGSDWRHKLAQELASEEDALKKQAEGKANDHD